MLDSIEYQTVAIDSGASPAAIVETLAALSFLAPQNDENGNVQAVFRLDIEPDGTMVATVPAAADAAAVQQAAAGAPTPEQQAAAYAAAAATAEDHAAASAQLITDKLASVPVPRGDLKAILQALLGQAADAIPFFEQYALDPSMTAQQWTDFQQLDQATKDRLLYDVVRSMAAVMRYLTGDLPTSS